MPRSLTDRGNVLWLNHEKTLCFRRKMSFLEESLICMNMVAIHRNHYTLSSRRRSAALSEKRRKQLWEDTVAAVSELICRGVTILAPDTVLQPYLPHARRISPRRLRR